MAKSAKQSAKRVPSRQAKGRALTIGLNSVDPKHYANWSGELMACEADAEDMADIARSRGFAVRTLLTRKAKRNAVAAEIRAAAKALQAKDIFMLSYSGHGGRVPDQNGDEKDLRDETWCLFDGELLDDELLELWIGFRPGVRILVFSDSCHSGTVIRANYGALAASGALGAIMQRVPSSPLGVLNGFRAMPPEEAVRTYRKNQAFYDKLGLRARVSETQVGASVLLISGCQDNQYSSDGEFNGLFTARLKLSWNNGAFKGTYREFHRNILDGMPPTQSPNWYTVGAADSAFLKQQPFTI
ncbi:MAG: caspase family protein [Gemmatimonadales bacterium]|nr:caspase family protein [Gemmatimonadales bacterium]